ncbi:unnamed protein product, partial [Ceratitis capitata]
MDKANDLPLDYGGHFPCGSYLLKESSCEILLGSPFGQNGIPNGVTERLPLNCVFRIQ